jgi:hypothetical protein
MKKMRLQYFIVVGVFIISSCATPVVTEISPNASVTLAPTSTDLPLQSTPLITEILPTHTHTLQPTSTIVPDAIPVNTLPPGTYLLDNRCNRFVVSNNNEPLATIDMCVTSVTLKNNGRMRFHVMWTAYFETQSDPNISQSVEKGSDAENRSMYITDNLNNRYNHIATGGGAAYLLGFSPAQNRWEGWYEFQPAKADASVFVFHDDDQGVAIENIAPSKAVATLSLPISLKTNDIIYEPTSGHIYASVPDDSGDYENSIVAIDIATGEIIESIAVGLNPGKLALSDDGSFLYVGLNGTGSIRRVNLLSHSADLELPLPVTDRECDTNYATDIAVITNQPQTIAVSSIRCNFEEFLAIYENDALILATDDYKAFVIAEGPTPASFFGYDNLTSANYFYTFEFFDSELSFTTHQLDIKSNKSETDIYIDQGLAYVTNGDVIDLTQFNIVKTYRGSSTFKANKQEYPAFVYPDSKRGWVYFLSSLYPGPIWQMDVDGWNVQLKIFDQETASKLKEVRLPGIKWRPRNLINVGEDTLAFRTDEGQIFIIKWLEQF